MLKKSLIFSLLTVVATAGCSDNDSAPKPAASSEKPELSKAFKRIDTNGDSKIERKEYFAFFEKRIATAFKKFDGNKDNNLSMEEFVNSRAKNREILLAKGLGEEEISARFSKQYSTMDKDGSDGVSSEEYTNWRMRPRRKIFQKLDRDNNKHLSPAEFSDKPKRADDAGVSSAKD